jgi:hypothetical protein
MPARVKVMVATETFAYEDDNGDGIVHAGQRFASTHPAVKAYPDSFQPEGSDVEQATAAPGEKRARRRKAS